jgi:molybdate transport system substrate-binding protein
LVAARRPNLSSELREEIMKLHRVLTVVAAVPLVLSVSAQAAELRVSASNAVESVLEQVAPQFERENNHKLVFTFAPAAVLKEQIDQGASFDVAVLTASLTDALAKAGKIETDSVATIARAGLGVSVRAGAPKLDVSTDEALKRALLNAKSIGYNGAGAARTGNEAMLRKLGIADVVQPKIKLLDLPASMAVAKRDVELGLGPISEILPVSGAQFAGAFPSDLQFYLVFSAGVSSGNKDADAAKALIKLLTSPTGASAIKAKGLEPG